MEERRSLIKDMLLYVRQRVPPKPFCFWEVHAPRVQQQNLPPPPPPIPIPVVEKKAPPPQIQRAPYTDEMRTFFRQKGISVVSPLPPLLLLSFSQEAQERCFLDRLAKAVSSSILPATQLYVKEFSPKEWSKILASPSVQWVMAPLEELRQCAFLQVEAAPLHALTARLGSKGFIPLAPIAHYLLNPSLKRSLWHQLQSIPNTPLLRST